MTVVSSASRQRQRAAGGGMGLFEIAARVRHDRRPDEHARLTRGREIRET